MGIVLPGVKIITDSSFVASCDLGQSNDPTALCVMERLVHNEVTWKGRETRKGEEFLVRYLRRLPLGLSYVDQVRDVASLLRRAPLNSNTALIIDETGVGRPVGDLFNMFGLRPTRVTITGGDGQSLKSANRWSVAKGLLISALDARLHTGELKIAQDMPEADVLREELRDFQRHVSAAGRYSYDARTGKHDDLVLAVALALWHFVGRPKPPPPVQVSHARFVSTSTKE
jgi:hypothetical protein